MPGEGWGGSAVGGDGSKRRDLRRTAITDAVARASGRTPRTLAATCVLLVIFAVAVVNAFLVVGRDVIDPTNISWMRGDPLMSYLGWAFFREDSRWQLPVTWTEQIGYPIGVSVTYLDTAPLAALGFRLVDSVLPQPFQYLGLLFLVGSVLQGYFGFKLLLKLCAGDIWFAAVGAGFLIVAPVLLFRTQAHFTLTQQWLILAALYFYFGDRIRAGSARYLLPFAVLIFVAGGFHPYLLVMVALIAVAAAGRLILDHRLTTLGAGAAAAGLVAVILGTLVVFGYVSPGASTSLAPYGTFSMNLLAPVDPQSFDAVLLRPLSTGDQQYEGYSYLGIGLIALLAVGVATSARRGVGRATILQPTILPLAILCLVSCALAVLPVVTLGPWRLFELPLPEAVRDALSPFQASGRFFWPVYYLLIVAALVLVRRFLPRRWGLTLIAAMLVVQAVDVSSLHAAMRSNWTVRTAQLQAHDWRTLGANHAHLVVIPAYQCDSEATPGGKSGFDTFGRMAVDQRMTINSYYAARTTVAAKEYFCDQQPQHLLSAGLAEDTAYVFAPDFFAALVAAGHTPTRHFCRDADGFVLCARDTRRAGLADGLLQRNFPATALDQDLLFGPRTSPGLVLDGGWSFGEDWGRWTEATDASLCFRLAERPATPLTVTMRLRAFALKSLPARRIRVVINGASVADWSFSTTAPEVRSFAIPPSAVSPSGIVTVHFEIPDALSPATYGVGADSRLLGLGASSLRVTRGP